MKRAGLDEPEAFRRLQKAGAGTRTRSWSKIAHIIVTADEAFQKGV